MVTPTGGKAIPGATDGLDEAVVAELFKRLAQPADVHVDGALFHVDVAAPDAVEELVALVDPLRVGHEELQHAVLRGPERNGLFTHQHPMARLVEREAFELDAFVPVVGRRAAQYRIDARDQLAGREGLGDVVVRTAFEARHLVTLFRSCGEHDDGQLAGFPVSLERAGELEAAHVGQHPVDEHEIGSAVCERSAGGTAVFRFTHFKTVTLEAERDHLADRAFVFDYQNLFGGHARPGFRGRAYYRAR